MNIYKRKIQSESLIKDSMELASIGCDEHSIYLTFKDKFDLKKGNTKEEVVIRLNENNLKRLISFIRKRFSEE